MQQGHMAVVQWLKAADQHGGMQGHGGGQVSGAAAMTRLLEVLGLA
jgi:hypothetical protein